MRFNFILTFQWMNNLYVKCCCQTKSFCPFFSNGPFRKGCNQTSVWKLLKGICKAFDIKTIFFCLCLVPQDMFCNLPHFQSEDCYNLKMVHRSQAPHFQNCKIVKPFSWESPPHVEKILTSSSKLLEVIFLFLALLKVFNQELVQKPVIFKFAQRILRKNPISEYQDRY